MKGLALPNDIQEIGEGAFKDTAIKAFTLSDKLKILGSKIFEGCVLEEIILPSSNQEREIAEDAFPDQSGLTIVIPKGLTDLSDFHFENYKNLTFQTDEGLSEDSPVISWLKEHRLTYKVGKNGPLITPDDISEPTPTPTATVAETEAPTPTVTPEPTEVATSKPTEVASPEPAVAASEQPSVKPVENPTPTPDQKPNSTPAASSKKSVYVMKNVKYKIKDNNTVTVVGTAMKTLKKLQIPDTVKIDGRLYKVTGIQNKAFKGQKKLETVSVGNYVKNVGNEAFADCLKLKRIQFGTDLTKLGKKVLYRDKKLTKIIFKGKKLKQIGKKTFEGVPRHVDIRAVRSKVKSYAVLIKKSQK